MGLLLVGSLILGVGMTGLVEAIQGGNVDEARRLVASGADLGRRDHRGFTSLMLAIEARSPILVDALIEAGADVRAQEPNGMSALRLALALNLPVLGDRLLRAGADPDERYPDGTTALMAAVRSRSMIDALLDAGADPNLLDDRGSTALMQCAAHGEAEAVRLLLDRGARPDLHDAEGQTAMSIARTHGNAKVRDLLCARGVADVDGLPPRLLDPALDFAARALVRGELHLVMGLAASGIDLKRPAGRGVTLLHVAARWGAPDAVPTLLEAAPSFPLEARDDRGRTPLWYAVLGGRTDVVRLLARQGASLEAHDGEGRRPLDVALLDDDAPMVRTLVELGAQVGRDQLSHAVTNDRVEALAAMLPHARPEDLAPFTVGHAADAGARRCAVLLFRLHPTDKDLVRAAQRGDDTLVQELVRLGANVHPIDGVDPLALAAARGLRGSVLAMLEAGARPHDRTRGSYPSAIFMAAASGHADLVRILREAGAPLNVVDNGSTPLGVAAKAGHLAAVEALVTAGASLDVRDFYGLSALDYARRGRHDEVARYLVAAGASTLDRHAQAWRRIGRDAVLTLLLWAGIVLATDPRRALLRPAATGLVMGAAAALLVPTAAGILAAALRLEGTAAIDPPYAWLVDPAMASALVAAIALHGAALVILGKLCPLRLIAALLVLGLSIGTCIAAWRAWFPSRPVADLVTLTGLPFLALAATIELRHRDPRLEASGTLATLSLAAAAAVVPLLCAVALVRRSW